MTRKPTPPATRPMPPRPTAPGSYAWDEASWSYVCTAAPAPLTTMLTRRGPDPADPDPADPDAGLSAGPGLETPVQTPVEPVIEGGAA